jgi:uncharacterized lipoprotein
LALAASLVIGISACSDNKSEQPPVDEVPTLSPDNSSPKGDTATYEQMPLKTNDSMPK